MLSRLSRIRRNSTPLGRWLTFSATLLILLGVLSWGVHLRLDLTADQRYSLNETTKTLLRSVKEPITISLYLTKTPNAGFRRLQQAVLDLISECNIYADIHVRCCEPDDSLHLDPITIYDHARDGASVATPVYPYLMVQYKTRQQLCNLLRNDRSVSGSENLNRSIEELEFLLANTLHTLVASQTRTVAFLEGHHEASANEVYDFTTQLARFFEVHRGTITSNATILDSYATVIIVAPKTPFTEQEKYILDQYLMRGGTILWLIDGVQFRHEALTKEGFTPILVPNTNIADMLFRYGVRIEPALVQDLQCLTVPVDMSTTDVPNFQPMPWTYAPLLLTEPTHPITRNVPQVLGSFVATLSAVGGDTPDIHKRLLLCSSQHSTLTLAPGEVNLLDFTQLPERFTAQFLPTAILMEGLFTSFFTHRLPPDGLTNIPPFFRLSVPTRQIIVSASTIACNEWEANVPLPMGYDRYTKRTFGNRDFLTNAVLYLAGNDKLLALRKRTVDLRLLNTSVAQRYYPLVQGITIITPIILLLLIGGGVAIYRHKKYSRV